MGAIKQPTGGKMKGGNKGGNSVGRTERKGGRAACIHRTDV